MNPNSEISRKDYIATALLSSIISHNGVYEDCVEHALELTDKLLNKLDESKDGDRNSDH